MVQPKHMSNKCHKIKFGTYSKHYANWDEVALKHLLPQLCTHRPLWFTSDLHQLKQKERQLIKTLALIWLHHKEFLRSYAVARQEAKFFASTIAAAKLWTDPFWVADSLVNPASLPSMTFTQCQVETAACVRVSWLRGNPDKMKVMSVVWNKQPEAIVEIIVAICTYIHNLGVQLDQQLLSDDQVAVVAIFFLIYSWSEGTRVQLFLLYAEFLLPPSLPLSLQD